MYTATYRLEPIHLEAGSVSLPDHIGQLQILGFHIPFHPLHLIDGFLRTARLQL
jgi:hypothetical protein